MHFINSYAKKKPKEKKKKLGMRRTLSNLRFSLSMVWQLDKLFFLFYFTGAV